MNQIGLLRYLALLSLYVLWDLINFTCVANNLYSRFLRPDLGLPRWGYAVWIYLFYPLTVTYLTRSTGWWDGLILGLTVYGTYNLTTASLSKEEPDHVLMVWDTVAGSLVSALLASLGLGWN